MVNGNNLLTRFGVFGSVIAVLWFSSIATVEAKNREHQDLSKETRVERLIARKQALESNVENSLTKLNLLEKQLTPLGGAQRLKSQLEDIQDRRSGVKVSLSKDESDLEIIEQNIQEYETKDLLPNEVLLDEDRKVLEGLLERKDELQKSTSILKLDLEVLDEKLKSAQETQNIFTKKTASKQAIESNLQNDKRELQTIYQEMEHILKSNEQQHKSREKTGIVFASILGLIIFSFFIIVGSRSEIAVALFSGDQGIQFITLFLIVTAIIMFGFLGTLESRELSALLGALSGYILGKSTTKFSSQRSRRKQRKSRRVGKSGEDGGKNGTPGKAPDVIEKKDE